MSSSKCMAFFFQAEDGIRDRNVTGVQTCALPIFELGRLIAPGLPPDPGMPGAPGTGGPRQTQRVRRGERVHALDRELPTDGGQRAGDDRPGFARVVRGVGEAALAEDVPLVRALRRRAAGPEEQREQRTSAALTQGPVRR